MEAVVFGTAIVGAASTRSNFHSKPSRHEHSLHYSASVRNWRCKSFNKLFVFLMILPLWVLVRDLHGEKQADRAVGYLLFPLLGTAFVWWRLPRTRIFQFSMYLHCCYWYDGILPVRLATLVCLWSRPQAIFLLPVEFLSVAITTFG